MKIAVVGLGLIGGSFEKAAIAAGHDVLSMHHGDERDLSDREIVMVCLPPDAIVPWIREHANRFAAGATVVDICGVKRAIVTAMRGIPRRGWHFVGGHPMAGREVGGYANSTAGLFAGASMVITPVDDMPNDDVERLKEFFKSVGFLQTVVTTPEKHDDMIAFTSQLCHVIATSYARDGRVADAVGFSAGSYANMTRIATQDDAIWCELYRSNRDSLAEVLDGFIGRLVEFRDLLKADDAEGMRSVIREGTRAKREELLARKRGDEDV